MKVKNPSPASRSLGTLSHKGRGLKANDSTLPSPLVGEGVNARSALTGEGAAGRTLRFAKQLRKNMTDAETRLWHELRAKRFENYKFKRQVPIGKYIADFACLTHKLIVEVDGSQHEGSEHDRERDAWLTSVGYRVLRFWNIDTFKALDGTLLAILDALNETPHPSRATRVPPSPSRGEGRSNRS